MLGSIIGGSDFDDSEGDTSDEFTGVEDQPPPSLDRLGLYKVCFVTFNKELGRFYELLFIMEKKINSLHFDVFFLSRGVKTTAGRRAVGGKMSQRLRKTPTTKRTQNKVRVVHTIHLGKKGNGPPLPHPELVEKLAAV